MVLPCMRLGSKISCHVPKKSDAKINSIATSVGNTHFPVLGAGYNYSLCCELLNCHKCIFNFTL